MQISQGPYPEKTRINIPRRVNYQYSGIMSGPQSVEGSGAGLLFDFARPIN